MNDSLGNKIIDFLQGMIQWAFKDRDVSIISTSDGFSHFSSRVLVEIFEAAPELPGSFWKRSSPNKCVPEDIIDA